MSVQVSLILAIGEIEGCGVADVADLSRGACVVTRTGGRWAV